MSARDSDAAMTIAAERRLREVLEQVRDRDQEDRDRDGSDQAGDLGLRARLLCHRRA